MFGKNPQRKREYSDELAVQEIFHTLQGEGPFSGEPAVFVRLAGCHLACHFCDTEFESGINNRMHWQVVRDQIDALLVKHAHTRLIVITGGEPLRQQTGPLVAALISTYRERRLRVQYETAGNLWDPSLDKLTFLMTSAQRIVFVVSPKTSMVHPMIQNMARHFKYVLSAGDISDEDGLPVMGMQKVNKDKVAPVWRSCLHSAFHPTIWVSPCDAHDPFKNKANMKAAVESALKYGYRLSLQTHKIVKVP